jgi:serpin B
MSLNPLAPVLLHLRRLTASAPDDGDGPLLTRFVHGGDQTAFAALVRRHGPMVLGVARRLLADAHAADDVFQATFLLLARKGPGLHAGSLAGWLHAAALRLALKARARTAVRLRHEYGAAQHAKGETVAETGEPIGGDDPAAAAVRREAVAVLDEEMGRLPEKYRAPLVLCYLEGLTNEEAAARLSWPVGSVKGRLSRARDLLADRLSRRGLALAVPMLAGLLAETAAAAVVPLPLLDVTVQAAAAFAAGQSLPAAGVSTGAVQLVQGTLRAMTLHKLKLTAALMSVVFLAAGAAAMLFPKAVGTVQADEPPAVFTMPVETPQIKADREAVAKGNTQFAVDLYKKLAENKEFAGKNLFLSPYSVSTALAMTYAGARTTTATEMEKTLHFPVAPERLHPAFAGLVGRLQANKKDQGYELAVANALWGQQSYPWQKEFLKTTHANYDAGLRPVDFQRATEEARQTINKWVEDKTHDKIKELIRSGILTSNTRLVLTNAIYFKGDWNEQFDKKLTKEEPFLGAGKETKAPLMHQTGEYGYLEGDGFQALELPYKGNQLSMVVILPKKADGLAAIEKDLAADQLTGWLAKLHPQKVAVSLPKFTTTVDFQLNEELKALGMPSAFDENRADFSGMDGEKGLHIASVVHKAFIDVNEEGTEAAAATAVIISTPTGLPRPPAVFRADHPFLFLIRDKQTGSVLFLGRLLQPNS